MGELPQLADGAFQLGDRPVDLGRTRRVQIALDGPQAHARGDQPLLRPIVQVSFQPAPLGNRGSDEAPPADTQTKTQPAHLDRNRRSARQVRQPSLAPRRTIRDRDARNGVAAELQGQSLVDRAGLAREIDPSTPLGEDETKARVPLCFPKN